MSENFTDVVLAGGLGNQLFQLANGMYVSDGKRFNLIENIFPTRKNIDGTAEIFSYLLPYANQISEEIEVKWHEKRFLNLLLKIFSSGNIIMRITFKLILSILRIFRFKISSRKWTAIHLENNGARLQPFISKSGGRNLVLGYFQTTKWSESEILIQELKKLKLENPSDKVKEFTELALSENPLVIHVRLTDYLTNPKFGILSKPYYQNAIRELLKSDKFKTIWLFSDDIVKATKIIPPEILIAVREFHPGELSAAETLEVMRLGYGYVIANSTFSWWGAFLSHQPNVNVIAPWPWFKDEKYDEGIYPKRWQLLNAEYL